MPRPTRTPSGSRGAAGTRKSGGLGRFPTAEELDKAVADRPVWLERVDGHAAWANSKAIQLAKVTAKTKDPKGGEIIRKEDGSPAGVFVDGAQDLVAKHVPEPTEAEQAAALEAALKIMASVGLTGVHDAGIDAKTWTLYRRFGEEGRLTTRIYAMIGGTGKDFDILSKEGPQTGLYDGRLSLRSVKLYSDGALGSRGAALLEPYSDAPDSKGLPFHSDAAVANMISKAIAKGYQVNVHAIGDAANRQILNAFEMILRHTGQGLRHRIEHAQVLSPEDIKRLAQLGLIASMQPTHATSDWQMAEKRLGHDRLEGAYAWRTVLNTGAKLAFGSDFPVESPNPFYGLHAAVTRQTREGEPPGGWRPEEKLSLVEAFHAFTLGAAYAGHQESQVGSLTAGKWADFILVDKDIFKSPPSELWQTKVLETWVAGKRVYCAEGRCSAETASNAVTR
ncbi:amidohydrolase [Pedomonas mirosovicensis]|uniref:amidohydrolase n=1 Tax=Pedomonas mirosovicensis TaxID=2908641 RepID=UPI00286EC8BE|nr:amidohydrolase [Pedomonas mirosovicensis]